MPNNSMRYKIPAECPKRGREVETENHSMKRVRSWLVWTVAVATVIAWNSAAIAQTTPGTPGTPTLGQYASDNVSGGAIRARSPGNMVGAGVVRAKEAADFARGGIEIVETTTPTSPRAKFLSDAIKIIFDQLNSTLLYLGNILLQRAGLPPVVPPVTPPAADTAAPTVSSTRPTTRATGVAVNTKITATFSEAMDPTTIAAANLTVAGPDATPVTGTVAYDVTSNIATFTPNNDLMRNTEYTATITTGVEDLARNALANDFVWAFTTGITQDTTAPLVKSTDPENDATGVVINTKITATFSEAMDPLTITTANYTVIGPGSTSIIGTVSYDEASFIATFDPTADLAPNALYTARITTGVEDLAGNTLAVNKVWTFTTADTQKPRRR